MLLFTQVKCLRSIVEHVPIKRNRHIARDDKHMIPSSPSEIGSLGREPNLPLVILVSAKICCAAVSLSSAS